MKYELNTYNRNLSNEELLDDLKKVAVELGKNKIIAAEYDENGKYSSATIHRRFGSWNKALQKAALELTTAQNISDKELFENIEMVWISFGRQPKHREMKRPVSKYSERPYISRFGSWRKALEAFVEFIDSGDSQNQEIEENISEIIQDTEPIFKHATKRSPSERLKVRVLMRDGNKCKLCGITVAGEDIHFDHIKPWSKGGETVLENLQILCAKHNLAKGNVE